MTADRLRIVIPTIDYPPIEGGIATVTLQTARALAELGHEVTVIAPCFPDMDAFDDAEPYAVHRFKGYNLGWLRWFPLWRAAAPHLNGADRIIAINIAYGGIIGRFFGARTPYTALAYGFEFLKFQSVPVIGTLIRNTYLKAGRIVAISEYTRTRLAAFGVPESRVTVCPPGASEPIKLSEEAMTDVCRRYAIEGRRIILATGRLIKRKNQVALIRALPKIREAVPDAALIIAGRGPEIHTLSRAAVECGVRNHVLLPGKVSDTDLAGLYAACELFALPNTETAGGHVEGFGIVFTEAGAYGKAVVAGRSGGAVEAVRDGETGIFVDPNDDETIADAIIRILNDDELRNRLAAEGQRRAAEDLTWERFARALVDPVSTPNP